MLRTGDGKYGLTASATTAEWIPLNAGGNNFSVFNSGLETVFCLVNCSIEEFDTLYATGNVLSVRGGMGWNFNGDNVQSISRICYRTASSTTTVDFNVF